MHAGRTWIVYTGSWRAYDTPSAEVATGGLDLTVPATLSGTVKARDGRPLQGARVSLWGSDAQSATGASGSFALSGLPAGTYALEVRAIGYAPKRVPVTLSSRLPNAVGVVLDQHAVPALEPPGETGQVRSAESLLAEPVQHVDVVVGRGQLVGALAGAVG